MLKFVNFKVPFFSASQANLGTFACGATDGARVTILIGVVIVMESIHTTTEGRVVVSIESGIAFCTYRFFFTAEFTLYFTLSMFRGKHIFIQVVHEVSFSVILAEGEQKLISLTTGANNIIDTSFTLRRTLFAI